MDTSATGSQKAPSYDDVGGWNRLQEQRASRVASSYHSVFLHVTVTADPDLRLVQNACTRSAGPCRIHGFTSPTVAWRANASEDREVR